MTIRVVCVCSGNLCRSPQTEQLLRASLPEAVAAEISVSSLGTLARDGAAMHPAAAEWSVRLGGDPTRHRATYLTPAALRGAGLVLALAREHRAAVVSADPSLTRVSFTVRELARLAGEHSTAALEEAAAGAGAAAGTGARLNALLAVLARSRGQASAQADRLAYDVVDPICGAAAAIEQSARQIHGSLRQVVRVLAVASRVPDRALDLLPLPGAPGPLGSGVRPRGWSEEERA